MLKAFDFAHPSIRYSSSLVPEDIKDDGGNAVGKWYAMNLRLEEAAQPNFILGYEEEEDVAKCNYDGQGPVGFNHVQQVQA